MKKLISTITIILSLASFNVAFAQTSSEQLEGFRTQLQKQPMKYCYGTLTAAMDIHKVQFFEFLDKTFRNKSSNSSLTNIAIARFTQYRLALEDLFAQIKPSVHYSSLSDEDPSNTAFNECTELFGIGYCKEFSVSTDADNYEKCYQLMLRYADEAKSQMVEHIKNNTAQKKTLVILEKYAYINEKMRTLNFEVAQMYGYFTTFKDKLHWINGTCVPG